MGAILNDLVSSGLIYQTGRGIDALYRVTSEVDLRHLADGGDPAAVAPVVWSAVYDQPGTSERDLVRKLSLAPEVVTQAVESLIGDGRLRRDAPGSDAPLAAEDLVVPVGATQGWEVAVHDHFRAVANAIASKLRSGQARSRDADVTGGGTLSFDLSADHPYRGRATALLSEVRARVNALWNELEAYNARHPIEEAERQRLFFYFGQYLEQNDDDGSAPARQRGDDHDEA